MKPIILDLTKATDEEIELAVEQLTNRALATLVEPPAEENDPK